MGALLHAVQAIAMAHDMLRSRYGYSEATGEPVQWIVGPESASTVAVRECVVQSEAAVEQVLREEVQMAIELAHGAMRLLVAHLEGGMEHIVLLNVHHIAFDGVSIEPLASGLSAVYNAVVRGQEVPELRPRAHYLEWAAWQRAWQEERCDCDRVAERFASTEPGRATENAGVVDRSSSNESCLYRFAS